MQVGGQTIHYSLTRKDLFKCQVYGTAHNRLLHGLICLCLLLTFWVGSRPAEGRQDPLPVRLAGGMVAALLALAVATLMAVAFLALSVWTGKHKGILGDHTLTLTEEGLASKSPTSESLLNWAGIHRVVSTKGYVFIYVSELQIKMIPKRAFHSADEAVAVERQIRNRLAPS